MSVKTWASACWKSRSTGHLLGRERGLGDHRDQALGLLAEQRDVGHLAEGFERGPPVGKGDPAEPARRALGEEERVVVRVASHWDRLELRGPEEVARQELEASARFTCTVPSSLGRPPMMFFALSK